jgi:hypothetical protein
LNGFGKFCARENTVGVSVNTCRIPVGVPVTVPSPLKGTLKGDSNELLAIYSVSIKEREESGVNLIVTFVVSPILI